MLLWAGVQVRAEVPVSSGVRLPRQVKRDVVPRTLVSRREELVSFARRHAGGRADDIVQEASVRALSRAEQLSSPEAARAWVYSIVRNLVAEGERATEALDEGLAEDAEQAPDACGCVLIQLRALPEAQARLLERVVVDGAEPSSLAAELGVTQNALWVRLHRAREALRARLAKHCGTRSLRQCLDCGCLERGCCR